MIIPAPPLNRVTAGELDVAYYDLGLQLVEALRIPNHHADMIAALLQ